MATKEIYIGSVGPMLYDDSTFPEGIQCEGPISIGTGADPGHAARIDDLPTLTSLLIGTPEQGDVIYYDGSDWTILPHGNDGDALTSGGHGANPSWEAVSSGGGDWTADSADWIYVSANSFKIVGLDVTDRFPVGTKLYLSQLTGGEKWFYVVSAVFVTDTTVTIAAGSAHTLANETISGCFRSYASSPTGFPHWFNYDATPTAGFSVNPSGGNTSFKIEGREVTVNYFPAVAGTSNAATYIIPLPVPAITLAGWSTGGVLYDALDNGAWKTDPAIYSIGSGATATAISKDASGATWTTSGAKLAQGQMSYRI